MTYTFSSSIKRKDYNQFIENNSAVSFMQEYDWVQVKKDWQHLHCALYQDNEVVAVCTILIRSFPLGIKFFYVPKGYVLDFNNSEIVTIFTKEIVKLAKKRRGYVLKIDPNFCVKETGIEQLLDHKEIQIPNFTNHIYISAHENLLSAGFALCKRDLALDSTYQPRFNMAIPLTNKNYKTYDENQLKSTFRKKIRRYFGNFHQERGVYYEHTNDSNRLDEFIEMIHKTETRQHINLRNKAYFQSIMDNFNAYLFFGKLDLYTYANFIRNKDKEKELQDIERQLAEGKTTITLSASLVIIPKNRTGIRTSEYLYTGNNLDFDKLYASYGLVYNICNFSMKQGCHFLNLGGVDGTLEDHLSMFKARFNPVVWEFSGEYDFILNPLYYPIEKLLPSMKKMYLKLKHNKTIK